MKKTNTQEDDKNIDIGTPFVESSPKQDGVTNAYLEPWDEENDRDIIGNTYPLAMKLTVYNMINAIGGGSSNITADVHMPFGGKVDETYIVSFVVAEDMVGNGSSAKVTVYSGEEVIIPTFTLESSTTDEISHEIDFSDVRDLVIKFDCDAIGSGFCAGIVLEYQE